MKISVILYVCELLLSICEVNDNVVKIIELSTPKDFL